MANTIDFILTNAASELIAKVLGGKNLNFTRMAVGDGFCYDSTAAKDYTALVNEVLSIDITKSETLSASSVKVTSAFKNTDAQKEFYYREVGLYAQDPDTGEEILYAYGNRNDAAELITPTGSSVVTKQLVFIISVGNSANVTFNVNADVYALQEDMLSVQENITTLQTNKADKNLANTGMITNCLLEIPHRIKYNLANGTLTIKAGSVIIVPYGTKDLKQTYTIGSIFLNNNYKVVDNFYSADGKFYVWVELQNDLSISYDIKDTNERLCFIRPENNSINSLFTHTSGTEAYTGTANCVHYRTDLNQVEQIMNKQITTTNNSLPFLKICADGTNMYGSVSQVFNGFGYIGSHVWIDKGVKGLIPNGKNPDGTLNNIEYTVPNITFLDCSHGDFSNIGFYIDSQNRLEHNHLVIQEEISNYSTCKTYVPSKNQIFYTDYSICKECYFAEGTILDKKITSFKPYAPFQLIDKTRDKQWLASLALPSEKYIDYELGERGSTYTAPANGWFALRKDAGFINAQVSLAVWNSEESFEFFRTTKSSPVENTQITCFIPISKGQKLAVDYDATGTTIYFRFIYAQGEVI